jgi:hypothetical protein
MSMRGKCSKPRTHLRRGKEIACLDFAPLEAKYGLELF